MELLIIFAVDFTCAITPSLKKFNIVF